MNHHHDQKVLLIYQAFMKYDNELACELIQTASKETLIQTIKQKDGNYFSLLDKIILQGNEEILNAYMSRVDIKKEEAKKYLFTLNKNQSLRGSRYEMFLSLYNLGLTFTENETPKVIELFSYLVESVKEHQENDYYQSFEKILSTYLNEKINVEYICIKHLHSLPNRNIEKAKTNLMRMYEILEKYVDVSNLGSRINMVKDKKDPNLTISARNLNSTECLNWFTFHIDIHREKKLLESELLQGKENNKKLKI